ncbi:MULTISPECIES: hypothetical protein [Flavobacterium]|jgi:uncharacterized Zn finger protein (UPF0148 family)|uniref:Uncharacterized protein n=2 Tax=Flavobacterium johnsoniae TaxID=986 RepID=A0A1M5IQF0_FLAJO|nr:MULTISPECIES: hypothetical protein [Flavobacterium]ABQ07677.1 hypothetical protein Fjoh_4678 [Flavobacterium johnsoniae UW101]OXG01761.1 hypothetical protein B0A63_03640 [Flavobacterium johnsoniae UW101]WDF58424.1 hypothetical protein PQ462_17055 [Flavobacterium sp. KACC 22758]WQG80484.1 hypothetical protein SR927_20980 [Flavobacterium johnsoniae UW101]SHG30481.1 hypothetical protein SAMN05444388_102207 [Flavobacterium johnsoniae]
MEEKKVNSFLSRLKENAQKQTNYGGEMEITEAKMNAKDCPNCGAGRAKQDGLTHCAYCGFEFLNVKLTDGVYIKKEDNSI